MSTRYIDLKYTKLLKSKLRNFKTVDNGLFNFSCPICGDSKKNASKARGYIYTVKNGLSFKCHNCDASMGFSYFLKTVAPALHKEYRLEVFSDIRPIEKEIVEKVADNKLELNLPTISSLPEDHIAKKYIRDRIIPEFAYSLLYYAEDFYSFARTTSDKYKEKYSSENTNKLKEGRIIIPFYNKDGEIIALQGRAVTESKLRYITLKISEDSLLVYGMERINFGEQILVVEGPIDSLFLNNCVAVAGSDLKRASESFTDLCNATYIFDNEPRNIHICKSMKALIDSGKKIVIWPKNITQKDINDMCVSGISRKELTKIINNNSHSGIRANLEFSSWKKC